MKAYVSAVVATGCLLSLSLALAAQDKARAYKYQKDELVYAELAKAPQKARAKRNPLEKDPDAVGAGGVLFEQHCSECHGDMAEGGKKGPSLLVDEVQSVEHGAIFWILTNGVVRRGMPVWSKLPEPQRWQLVSYIKSLGATKAQPSVPVSPSAEKVQP